MNESCLFFPEMYRLYDREKESGTRTTEEEFSRLADRCTLCGLCPCPSIRTEIVRAKTVRVREKGMPLRGRMLADIQSAGKCGTRFPGLVNSVIKKGPMEETVKRFSGIARERKLPRFPSVDFFTWARKNGLKRMPEKNPKAAYFVGCMAAFLFPEVARACVDVLEKNGIAVYVPPQQCCGMPTLVEGAEQLTRERVRKNLHSLLDAAASGCDLLCSCPSCGFFMKVLLKEGAFYTRAYQESVNAGRKEILVPGQGSGKKRHYSLSKSMYERILSDTPYFSGIDPMQRISISEKISDLGQYLEGLHRRGRLNARMGAVKGRMAYFAPCHQREQDMGGPYEKLLKLVPGLDTRPVAGAMDCCGMGGSLGFKETLHQDSIGLAEPLVRKIRAASPEALITDCLSCRLQFRHLMPELKVFHPLEILKKSYGTQE